MRINHTILFSCTVLLSAVLAYPHKRDEGNFIFGVIGDSWASGVAFVDDSYDNDAKCRRVKYAWSTVINSRYAEWAPEKNKKPQFEFKACSGAHMDNMMEQMDQLTRPKIVFMEVGGNDLDFYPMADACLFHSKRDLTYGTPYQDDNRDNPSGLCRREIKLVRQRFEGTDKLEKYGGVIDSWKNHKAVVGNNATLFVHGYPWFFSPAVDGMCDTLTFNVLYNMGEPQPVVKDLRLEFNSMIDLMNGVIRGAVERLNDPQIQYIDINPAFDGHRLCEPGHSRWDQFNQHSWASDKVWIFNAPTRLWITVRNGQESKTYDSMLDNPPEDLLNKVINYPEGESQVFGNDFIQAFHNPSFPDLRVEFKTNNLDPAKDNIDNSTVTGSGDRTLHPTQSGHRELAGKIIKRLQTYYGTVGSPPPCPDGCDCSAGFPRCS